VKGGPKQGSQSRFQLECFSISASLCSTLESEGGRSGVVSASKNATQTYHTGDDAKDPPAQTELSKLADTGNGIC